ncbi:MAG: MMPL family transporter [Proteobacteria bacterium]|nr:MMPL family transporter [Pseudomonadota bacterium]
MIQSIHRLATAYIKFVSRHERTVLLLALATFAASVWISSGLELKSDLKELLPPDYQSVMELNRVLEHVGGIDSLIVAAEGPDVEANKRFMDDLAQRLADLAPGKIRYVNYKADRIRRFYEDHFLYYMDLKDLETFHSRLKRRVDYEKFKRTPFFLDLDEGEAAQPEGFDFDSLRERYEKRYRAPVETVDDYYGGEWGRMLIMVIRPFGTAMTVGAARSLVSAVEAVVEEMGPASYSPGMRVGFCGNVKSTIEEYETMKRDILSTSLLCIGLVSIAIVVYFLRIRVVFMLGGTLLLAISWTFAITRGVIGYLNAQTAFLGSIIVGTGINYGIILMARYLEERKRQRGPAEAMELAIEATAVPTFLAAVTTAVAFAVLFIARIRGLSQFGFIGALGVMLCWAATVLVLPAMMTASEKIHRFVRPRAAPRRESALFAMATRVAARSPAFIIGASLMAAVAAVVVIVRFAPNAIEYDFTKMRNQVSVSSGTEALEKRVSRLFKHSMTPSVALVDSIEQGRQACEAVMARNDALPPEEQRVGSCHSIYDLLPEGQEEKLPVIARIGALLSQEWLDKAGDRISSQVKRVKRSVLNRPLTVEDMPDDMTRHFEDRWGNRGALVFINPRPGMLLSDGRNLVRFADTIREITLPDGVVLHAASASLVFSDLISIIKDDAPLLTAASLAAVILLVLLMLKSVRRSAVIVISLLWAVLVMAGAAAFLGIKVNFFNFIVLPLTFGIGVDYAVNMAMRLRQEWPDGVAKAIRHTGPAVILCSVTTIIGYFVLTTANNQALATFGTAAVIGEIACISSAVLLVPACLVWYAAWRRGRKG